METHAHHPHTVPGKKWTHYLFEFFMLFLAVTLGFFVENLREGYIEHHREKQFIRSLVEDLKRDSSQIRVYMQFNENISKYCDSVQSCIANTNIFENSNNFYNYSRELARYIRYNPTDRTIQQLKNGGNMRLIRNWVVSNAITEYDSRTKSLAEIDQQLNGQIVRYREYLVEFLDLASYDKLNPAGSFMDNNLTTRGNPGYITADAKKAKIIYNQVFTLKAFLSGVQTSAETVAEEAKQLLILLQKEYNLENG
jgi:hypothetical protein